DGAREESTVEAASAVSDARPAAQKSVGVKAKRRGNAGRLPAYYASIVDSRQRQAIYEIRERMASQLEQLEKQLAALRRAELSEIEGVLTAVQRTQLQSLSAQRSKPAKSASAEPAAD
ncbi:MAG: hypothetical protein ABI557_21435, partial [Aureliella sp.]